MQVLNPTDEGMWDRNFVMSGVASRYSTTRVAGTLSVKSLLRGTGVWTTSEGRFTVSEDNYLILNHGQTYELEISQPSSAQTFCAFFAPAFVDRILQECREPLGRALEPTTVFDSLDLPERLNPHGDGVTLGLNALRLAMDRKDPDQVQIDEAFGDLAQALGTVRMVTQRERERLRFTKTTTRDEIHRRLWQARDAVLAQPETSWTLELMASQASLSAFHFHRLFKEAFGLRPSQFLRQVRISKAARLLKSGSHGVTETAFAVGYLSPTSFAASFQRLTGATPSDYRQSAN